MKIRPSLHLVIALFIASLVHQTSTTFARAEAVGILASVGEGVYPAYKARPARRAQPAYRARPASRATPAYPACSGRRAQPACNAKNAAEYRQVFPAYPAQPAR